MAKTKEKEINLNPNRIGLKEGMGYALGDAGNLFVLTYVSSYLKMFYSDVLKIDLTTVAFIFLFTRLWDAINDPIWGGIVAKRKPGANGKFRPYLIWFSIPLAISELVCFFNVSEYTKNHVLIIAFATFTYTVFGMMYTAINVPFGSLASVITDDPAGRTLLSTFRAIGGGIGGAATVLLAPKFIFQKNTEGVKIVDAGGAFKFAVAMAFFSIIFYFLCYKTTKERIPSVAQPKIDFKKTYKGMFKSRPFVVLALTGILISGQLQFASLNTYLYKNYFPNEHADTFAIIGAISQYLPMAIMILFTPKLVKKFGKKELSGFGSVFAAIAAVACFIIKPKPDQAWIFFITLFIIGFGYSFVSITNWAVVSDVIDYQEYVTGERSESAIYAVYTFCRKLGQTIADFGGLMLLDKIGYDVEVMPSKGYVEGVSEGILFVCTLIPAITYTLIWLLYRFGYPLTKEKLVPVYEKINKSHEELIEKAAEQ